MNREREEILREQNAFIDGTHTLSILAVFFIFYVQLSCFKMVKTEEQMVTIDTIVKLSTIMIFDVLIVTIIFAVFIRRQTRIFADRLFEIEMLQRANNNR